MNTLRHEKSKSLAHHAAQTATLRTRLRSEGFVYLVVGLIILAIVASVLTVGVLPFALFYGYITAPDAFRNTLNIILMLLPLALFIASSLSAYLIAPLANAAEYKTYLLITSMTSVLILVLASIVGGVIIFS